MTARLIVEDLAVERAGEPVLAGVAFTLGPGEALVVTGANAAGKSTLLRALAGLLRASAGRIANPFAVALLGHEPALKTDRRLGDELAFWARLDGTGAAAVAGGLAAFGLRPLTDVPVRLLSAGQRRRAALARVLASGAPLWLLDEPAVGLDAANVLALEAAIARHRAAGGLAVVTTHQPLALDGAQKLDLLSNTAR